MTEIRLTLDKDEGRELEYILERIKFYPQLFVRQKRFKNFITLDIMWEGEGNMTPTIQDIIASVILIFYKYKIISKGVEGRFNDRLVHHALCGAILSFDEEGERNAILKSLGSYKDYSIKSIYEFRHAALRESWQNIITLANKLLAQCSEEEDLYDLIFFLIAIDPDLAPSIILQEKEGEILLYSEDIPLPIPKLTDNQLANILLAVVRERPGSIVINNPNSFDKELVSTIKRLGEGS